MVLVLHPLSGLKKFEVGKRAKKKDLEFIENIGDWQRNKESKTFVIDFRIVFRIYSESFFWGLDIVHEI